MKNIKVITLCTRIFIVAVLILSIAGCKKALEVDPSTNALTGEKVYQTDGGAQSLLSGIFSNMSESIYSGTEGMSVLQGLAADELNNNGGVGVAAAQFYTNNLNASQVYYWISLYRIIYFCNSGIAGITSSSSISAPVKQQLLGELKFIRAYTYFYACNLYGDVPLPLTTDYVTNNVIARSPKSAVQQQAIQDLKEAQEMLPDGKYLTGTNTETTERVRPNKQAATAALARMYLYLKDWANAETQSTAVISSASYRLEPNLNQVFLKDSPEAIWQLMPVEPGVNNRDAPLFVFSAPPNGLTQLYSLSSSLVQSFEPGDGRLSSWVGKLTAPATGTIRAQTYYFAYKYKNAVASNTTNPVTEYPILLRFAEQYLIRSEARAQQGNIAGAVADLNILRKRARETSADLPDFPASVSQAACLAAIAHERRIELFTEHGHRWFDLIRTDQANAVMGKAAIQKEGSWSPYKQLLPIPAAEITINRNLIQNPGY